MPTLATLHKRYPRIQLRLLTGAAYQVKAWVASGECDLGIVLDDLALAAFDQSLLKKNDFVLVSNRARTDLSQAGVIVTNKEKAEVTHLQRSYRTAFKQDLKIEMEVLGWGLIKSLARNGLGVGYIPRYVVHNELKEKVLFELPPPGKAFTYQIKAIWNKNRAISRSAKVFMDLLGESKL